MQPKTRREREVWEACDELFDNFQQEGISLDKMTGELIKNKLVDLGYNRGNPTQTYLFRGTWLKARELDLPLNPVTEKAVDMRDPIHRVVHRVREDLREEARVEIESIRQVLSDQINQLTAELEQEKNKNAEWMEKYIQLKDELRKSQVSCEVAEKQLMDEVINRSVWEERVCHLNNLIKDMKVSQAQSLEEYQKTQMATVKLHEMAVGEFKEVLESQRHHWAVTLDAEKTEKQKALSELQQCQLALQKVQIENQHTQKMLEQIQEEKSSFQYQISMQHSEQLALQEQLGALKQEANFWKSKSDERKQTYDALLSRVEQVLHKKQSMKPRQEKRSGVLS
jgi:hypothetical protein